MSWDSIIGQRRVKKLLQTALEGERFPHAWLFTGAEGIGKDAAAIEVGKVLRCTQRGGSPIACGHCHGCLSTASLQNANVRFVFALPSGKGEDGRSDAPMLKLNDAEISQIQEQIALKAANPYHNISIPRAQQIKISSVRQVTRDISMSSVEPGWRVVIVSEAQQMGDEAANAFLKTLEEPAANTLLILTSSSRERLLPTILSRCQEVRFDLLTEIEIKEALIERNETNPTTAGLLARIAGGSYSRAVELLSGDLNQLRFDVIAFVRSALRRSPLAITAEIERLTESTDRTRLERILVLLELWFRDALVMRSSGNATHIANQDQVKDLESFNGRFGHASLPKLIQHAEDAIRGLRSNAQIPLLFTVLALRISSECAAP